MNFKTFALGGLALGSALGLGACTDGYGYGGIGYASDGYYGGYADDGYYGDGYGYGDAFYGAGYGSYFGWYGDYYYPGTGIYVYDRYRRPHRWTGAQQRYWQGRYRSYLQNCRGATCRQDRGQIRNNWQAFRGDVRDDRRDYRGDVRDARQDYRSGEINRSQYQDRRQDARQDLRQDYRQERRQLGRQNRRDVGPGRAAPRPAMGGGRSGGSRPSRGGGRGG